MAVLRANALATRVVVTWRQPVLSLKRYRHTVNRADGGGDCGESYVRWLICRRRPLIYVKLPNVPHQDVHAGMRQTDMLSVYACGCRARSENSDSHSK
eukprot:3684109-Rhodomonas_salina.3